MTGLREEEEGGHRPTHALWARRLAESNAAGVFHPFVKRMNRSLAITPEHDVDLVQMRHFAAVAGRENFTRAAEQVGLSQPALSRSIAKLEEEIGQPLFERQTRKVSLTDAGRRLLDRVRTLLTLADELTGDLADDGETGKVRVAAIPTIAPYWLPACLHDFHRRHPKAEVIVSEDTTKNLLKAIADGDIDVAIVALPIEAKYVEVEPLFAEELFLVTGRTHPLAKKKSVSVADLAGHPFVLLGEAHCLTDNVVDFCRSKSLRPVSVERTIQLAMVQELVALGHGISLVPAMAQAKDRGPGRVYRSLAGQKPTRTIAMVTNPYRYHNAVIGQFRDAVRNLKSPGPTKGR
jgi:LysR family hydrogen peroxide-inducible transcriptional activator